MKKIVFFRSPENTKPLSNLFIDQLKEALDALGVQTELLSYERDNPGPFLEKLMKEPPDCTLSVNGLLPDDQGRFLSDMIKIPHVALITENPFFFTPLIKSKYTIFAFADRFSMGVFQGMNAERLFFLPLAVPSSFRDLPIPEKNIPFLLFHKEASVSSIESRWKTNYSKTIIEILHYAAELYFKSNKTSFVQALVEALDETVQQDPNFDVKSLHLRELLIDLEEYVEAKGYEIVHEAAQSFKPFIVEPKTAKERHDLIARSDVFIKFCSGIKNGLCYETLLPPLLHTFSVVDENVYLDEHFQNGKDICTYSFSNLNIEEILRPYLSDQKKKNALIKAEKEKILSEHTWQRRAVLLIDHLKRILSSW